MIVLVPILIILLIIGLLGCLHAYVWWRLVAGTTAPRSRARKIGTVVVALLPVLVVATFVSPRAGLPFPVQRLIAWPGYLWMALFLYLLLALAVLEPVRFVVNRRRKPPEPEPEPETDVSRRLFVARGLAAAAGVAAVGTVTAGAVATARGPNVKRVVVPLAKLPRSAHGLRIAVVSDIHLGAINGRAHAERITRLINATQPDLITVVGDLVDGDVEDLASAAAPLAALRSRLGTYFVTGNHEYFSGAEQWIEHVQELGMRPLANARVELDGFDLAGVNDVTADEGQGPDFGRALGGRDPSRASILLAHQPVVIHDAVKHGVDLQLSGHTHGGQLWPFTYVAAAANPTLAGLESYGDTQLYVSRGAGTWGPPVRVGAPADITVVQLASRQA